MAEMVVDAIRDLKVILTEDELKDIGKKQAQAVKQKSSIEWEFGVVKNEWKKKINDQEKIVHKCAELVNDGFEVRPVNCQWRYSWDENRKDLIRLDTGEIVETLAITADERQMWIDEQEEKADKEKQDQAKSDKKGKKNK